MARTTIARVEVAAWLLIYGGMFGFGLGLALQRVGSPGLGRALTVVGLGGGVAGLLLIWIRSRMRDPVDPLA